MGKTDLNGKIVNERSFHAPLGQLGLGDCSSGEVKLHDARRSHDSAGACCQSDDGTHRALWFDYKEMGRDCWDLIPVAESKGWQQEERGWSEQREEDKKTAALTAVGGARGDLYT